MTEIKTYDENDEAEIRALLLGRRIVAVQYGDTPRPDGQTWGNMPEGMLTLDDGTQVHVAPNDGACACGAGNYSLASLAAVDNVITSVRTAVEPHPDIPDDEDKNSYRIYVIADNVEINAVQIDGDDGNGYYGTGYELIVVLP